MNEKLTCGMCQKPMDFGVTRPQLCKQPICIGCAETYENPPVPKEQQKIKYHADDIRNRAS